MIPFVVAPLTGLTVLVTRPALQADSLRVRIEAAGGTAIAFPAIEIEALAAEPVSDCDLVVFVSANAVAHGAHLLRRDANMKIAAIGRATAAALVQAGWSVDIVPAGGSDSESLLAHPELAATSASRVLIVRGAGGRELLESSFRERGIAVETREVYRRVKPSVDLERVAALERRWAEEGIDAVTLTSVENLRLLLELLSDAGRLLLHRTPAVVASRRIGAALEEAGLRGGTIIAQGADDESMVDALARWNTRERTN